MVISRIPPSNVNSSPINYPSPLGPREYFVKSFIEVGRSIRDTVTTMAIEGRETGEFLRYAEMLNEIWDAGLTDRKIMEVIDLDAAYATLRSFLLLVDADSDDKLFAKMHGEAALETLGDAFENLDAIWHLDQIVANRLSSRNITTLTDISSWKDIWDGIPKIILITRINPEDPTWESPDTPPTGTRDIWFATDRALSNKLGLTFGNYRDKAGKVYYGTCRVVINTQFHDQWYFLPKQQTHRISKESITFLSNDDGQAEDQGYVDASKFKARMKKKEILLYLHGYNTSFEAAAKNAGLIGNYLNWDGMIAIYSWPSRAFLPFYLPDRDEVEISEEKAANFLEMIISLSQSDNNANELNVIAHSMGNRVFMRAVQEVLKKGQKVFDQVILAAADIPPALFRYFARERSGISDRITMYVSEKDKALKASKSLWLETRIGQLPIAIDGIDIIDVSKIADIDSKGFGHNYIIDNKAVQNDIIAVIDKKGPKDEVRKTFPTIGQYWQLIEQLSEM